MTYGSMSCSKDKKEQIYLLIKKDKSIRFMPEAVDFYLLQKIIGEILSSKYEQNLLTKKSATYMQKTPWRKAIQKMTEKTGDQVGKSTCETPNKSLKTTPINQTYIKTTNRHTKRKSNQI